MKIVFVVPFMSVHGGVERLVAGLSNELAENGHEVVVLSLYDQGPSYYNLNKGVKIVFLGFHTVSCRLSAIREFFMTESPKLIISVQIKVALISFFLKNKQAKLVAWEHTAYKAPAFYWRWARRVFYRFFAGVVILTKRDLKFYEKINSNVSVIYNFLPKKFENSELILENTTSKLRVLSVGRLVESKGFFDVVDAFQRMPKETKNKAVLTIVGSGPERNNIIEYINKADGNIEFYDSTNEIEFFYRESAIFVLASYVEGLPAVLIEAKAFGLACVAYDCDTGPSEIIRDQLDGFLVDVGDVKRLSAKISCLIEQGCDLNRKRELAMEDSRKFYLSVIYPHWERFLDGL